MSKYVPTIGLEIHAELNTKTKMFCDCLNDREETRPNFNVCPVCLAHPGTLPTINEKAVELVVKLGMALGSYTPELSKFDRKNYFYPDLPKGYQLSQYDEPLVKGGELSGVKLTRIHLEEDAGKLIHDDQGGGTLVDYNRAGRALMELVTEPDIHSAEDALKFAKELQLILKYLGVSDADMERGLMRFDANISVSADPKKLGTKVEVKNLNSFRSLKEAIGVELKRQEEILESGGRIEQETRGWDDLKKTTYSQRSKEQAHDYRYMPEPDLPPLTFTKDQLEIWKRQLPELPSARRERFIKEFKLKTEQSSALVEEKDLGEYYEQVISEAGADEPGLDIKEISYNYLTSDFLGLVRANNIDINKCPVTAENFADLMVLIAKGELSSRSAKDILAEMFATGGDPKNIMQSKNLAQISDESELGKMVAEIIAANPGPVNDFKKGKIVALEALIGRAMGKLKGRGNPEVLRQIFLRELQK